MPKKSFLLLVLMAVTITVTACSKPIIIPKKALDSVAFPKHPGTIKMLTMLDKSVKITPISEIPESSQFVYYDRNNVRTEIISKAVKAVPIVEERMYSRGEGKKLVPISEADYLWIEKYGPDGKLLKTSTMWRNGVRGGK